MIVRRKTKSSLQHSRSGFVAVLVAVSLIALMAALAFAIDGGFLMDKKQQVRATAEAAAMAGAFELFTFDPNSHDDPVSRAKSTAISYAVQNGFGDGDTSNVTVNIPPKTGEHAGDIGYVEAIVDYRYPRAFSTVFGSDPVVIYGRAVAAGTYVPSKASILVLDPKKKKSLHVDKASVEVSGDIVVNSKDKKAVELKKNAQIKANNLIVTGGIHRDKKGNINLSGDVSTNAKPSPDPLATLPEPIKGPERKADDYLTTIDGVRHFDLIPGTYKKKHKFEKNDVVTMQPGVYFFDDGDFEVKQHASLFADGVMIYTNKKKIKFDTDGNVHITPPATGPYAGISLFSGRDKKGKVEIKRNGNFDITGTIYVPNGDVKFQKTDFDLNGAFIGGKEEDDEGDYEVDEEWPDANPNEPEQATTYGVFKAQIIANRLKIDKHSHVTILGDAISVRRPELGVVE